MLVQDKIYAAFEINSPIILDLIATPAFQRLKKIAQFGLPDQYYHLQGYSRYEHSIGVYILLNKLGASEEEQVAGLLHDISHTAFSHLVDLIIGDPEKENYQDKRHLSVLQQGEVAKILEKYGYLSEQIADYHRYGLLERETPDLCADRIDYSLRESPLEIAKQTLPDLSVYQGEIVFSNEKSALIFAENFLCRQESHWGGYEAVTRYVLFADLLKLALADHVIVVDDLLKTDEDVLAKIINSGRPEYIKTLEVLKQKNVDFLSRSSTPIRKKFRFVDPKVLLGQKLMRLSELNKGFNKKLKQAKQSNNAGIYTGVMIRNSLMNP